MKFGSLSVAFGFRFIFEVWWLKSAPGLTTPAGFGNLIAYFLRSCLHLGGDQVSESLREKSALPEAVVCEAVAVGGPSSSSHAAEPLEMVSRPLLDVSSVARDLEKLQSEVARGTSPARKRPRVGDGGMSTPRGDDVESKVSKGLTDGAAHRRAKNVREVRLLKLQSSRCESLVMLNPRGGRRRTKRNQSTRRKKSTKSPRSTRSQRSTAAEARALLVTQAVIPWARQFFAWRPSVAAPRHNYD